MTALLAALMNVLSAWAVLWIMFTGLGVLVRRSFGLKTQNSEAVLSSFWMGWAFALFLLQLWHLQFPVDWRVLPVLGALAVMGLIWNRQDLWGLLSSRVTGCLCFWAAFSLSAIWLADHAIRPPTNYDSGLYHLAAVRWAASFPVVPGLANLHDRLGFHSSYFLYVAMLDVGPWVHRSHHLANGLLLHVVTAQILVSIVRSFQTHGRPSRYDLFNILLLVPVLKQALSENVSSPSPDLPIFLLGIVASTQLFLLIADSRTNLSKETGYRAYLIAILAVAGITVKLSFLAFGAAAFLLALGLYCAGIKRRRVSDCRKTIGWTAACTGVGLIPFVSTNIVLTGYVVFPSTVGAFPVEWRVPCEQAVETANWIRSWARQPLTHWSQVLGNWDWFGSWLHRIAKYHREDVVTPLVLFVSSLIVLVVARCQKNRDLELPLRDGLLFIPSVVSIIFWFTTAPEPRFIGASLWILAGIGVTFAVCSIAYSTRSSIVYGTFYLWLIFPLVPPLSGNNFYGPGGRDGFYPTPRGDLTTFVTHSQLRLYVPKERDLCWDAPLPCTPYPNGRLRLMREGDMSQGFVVDGKEYPVSTGDQLSKGSFGLAGSPIARRLCDTAGKNYNSKRSS